MLDVTYGNVSQEEAERLGDAAGSVDDVHHEPGSTEPWISKLVADLIIARGARTVLETGCFKGATTVYIQDALCRLGGGEFFIVDVDPARATSASDRAIKRNAAYPYPVGVLQHVYVRDILTFLALPDIPSFDLAWVDDSHEKPHVTKELTLLYPKMNPGGLILLHDVFGVCDLRTVVQQFGGYSIDLPRLGPAGGLGIIQVP
jgi:predicted O-methyltransferase YrrM